MAAAQEKPVAAELERMAVVAALVAEAARLEPDTTEKQASAVSQELRFEEATQAEVRPIRDDSERHETRHLTRSGCTRRVPVAEVEGLKPDWAPERPARLARQTAPAGRKDLPRSAAGA